MMTEFYMSSSSGLYLCLNAAVHCIGAPGNDNMSYLTLRTLNIWFSDVKGFEDSNVRQTDFQEQQLMVDVCLQARIFIPLDRLLSRSILCQLPGNAVGKRDPFADH